MTISSLAKRFEGIVARMENGDNSAINAMCEFVGEVAASGTPEDISWVRLWLSRLRVIESVVSHHQKIEQLESVLVGAQRYHTAELARRMREEGRQAVDSWFQDVPTRSS